MPTLHIQHPITDFETWASAFNRFADARRQAGVRAQRVQRPVDDPSFVVIDLDFDSTDEATAFRHSSKPRSGRSKGTHRRWSGRQRR